MTNEGARAEAPAGRLRRVGWIAGPAVAGVIALFGDLEPGRPEVTLTAAVAIVMACWWITEPIPLAATALLPVVLFPAFGIMSGKAVSSLYFNHVVFLFIGGFLVAIAMQRWRLHERIALAVLSRAGTKPRNLLAGFMAATAFLSAWISNTAATMMMVAIALAILFELEQDLSRGVVDRFARAILLGVAYSASIGGMATLVGTPPNLSFARIYSITFPDAPEISFIGWFLVAFPLSVTFLIPCWAYLSWRYCPSEDEAVVPRDVIAAHRQRLGSMSFVEKVVLADFSVMAVLWLTRADIALGSWTIPGWSRLFGSPAFLNDGTVAIAAALLLFLLPARAGAGRPVRILDWPAARELPWGVILLFGGGFALATGFKESGLSAWLGQRLEGLAVLPPVLIVAATCLTLTFLTELTSNTASAEMLLPILAALAVAMDLDPLLLMVPATLACSSAFMLPAATPPNAIVFGTERLRIADMARSGFVLNLLGVVLITAAVFLLGSALGIQTR